MSIIERNHGSEGRYVRSTSIKIRGANKAIKITKNSRKNSR